MSDGGGCGLMHGLTQQPQLNQQSLCKHLYVTHEWREEEREGGGGEEGAEAWKHTEIRSCDRHDSVYKNHMPLHQVIWKHRDTFKDV